MGKMPVRLSVQVSGKKGSGQLADGSPAYLLDLRLTMAFPTGLLTLLSVTGPVVWTSAPAQVLGNSEPLSAICSSREADARRAGRAKNPGERRSAELNSKSHPGTWRAGNTATGAYPRGQQGVGAHRAATLFCLT